MNLVFVYGTLLKGLSNHGYLANAQYLGKKIVHGLKMYNLGPFPACVKSGNNHDFVHGELYQVDDATLNMLDRLEGHPHMYQRIKLYFPNETWTYVMDIDKVGDKPLVKGGDWRNKNV